jgi:hypothetical protein
VEQLKFRVPVGDETKKRRMTQEILEWTKGKKSLDSVARKYDKYLKIKKAPTGSA